jgi:basic membrane protein A and related proteins
MPEIHDRSTARATAPPADAHVHALAAARRTTSAARALVVVAVALAVAACNSSNPSPSGPATPTPLVTTFVPTPSPTPQLVKTVTLVTAVIEPSAASLSGLAWRGVQAAATQAGAKATLVQPTSNAELAAAVESAAAGDRAVIVTIGAEAATPVAAAAVANPEAQFVELDVDPGSTAPPNVHGLVFDGAEAGYLAGFVAASFSASGKVGFAGTTADDAASASYSAGFAAGAVLARSDATAMTVLAGTDASPDHGHTAAVALVNGGADVVSAAAGVVGIAALREACGRKARLVAIETDAWQTVPDVRSCLVASVLLRYDVAVEGAVSTLASGGLLDAVAVETVATGGLSMSDLHVEGPAGFAAKLAGVLAALRNNPPRASAAPASAKP